MNVENETYVFFDIETTGLPWQEKNKTKIIEICLLAVKRQDIINAEFGSLPKFDKLSFTLNPLRKICPEVVKLTGLSNDAVKKSSKFKDKFDSIYTFLDTLQKPVCLIAHNGNAFDFKILLAECNDINKQLPPHLLCLDSLVGFRKVLKGTNITYKTLPKQQITSDEDSDWPELDISADEWKEIDELMTDDDSDEETVPKCDIDLKKRDEIVINTVFHSKDDCIKGSYTLAALYKRLLNKEAVNSHRAEADCIMLLECFTALKYDMLSWANDNCKYLCFLTPLNR